MAAGAAPAEAQTADRATGGRLPVDGVVDWPTMSYLACVMNITAACAMGVPAVQPGERQLALPEGGPKIKIPAESTMGTEVRPGHHGCGYTSITPLSERLSPQTYRWSFPLLFCVVSACVPGSLLPISSCLFWAHLQLRYMWEGFFCCLDPVNIRPICRHHSCQTYKRGNGEEKRGKKGAFKKKKGQ